VFLKTLIGLLKPDTGSIVIEGTDIASCSEKDLPSSPAMSKDSCVIGA
jgi:ABC-type transporter Mla maintaining outer membrane lipid asymmetry ATPase subunit MlaF